jgi:hypothetical protein
MLDFPTPASPVNITKEILSWKVKIPTFIEVIEMHGIGM